MIKFKSPFDAYHVRPISELSAFVLALREAVCAKPAARVWKKKKIYDFEMDEASTFVHMIPRSASKCNYLEMYE